MPENSYRVTVTVDVDAGDTATAARTALDALLHPADFETRARVEVFAGSAVVNPCGVFDAVSGVLQGITYDNEAERLANVAADIRDILWPLLPGGRDLDREWNAGLWDAVVQAFALQGLCPVKV